MQQRIFQNNWRKANKHNFTVSVNIFPISQVSVGNDTYGGIYVLAFNLEAKLIIGHYCSIAPGVKFLLSADHYRDHISSYPFRVKINQEKLEGVSKGHIIVEDDVWIGENAIILSGIHIAQGAVVAAGAVVTKDVPPYAVVGGNPARVIKYRFSDELIKELLKVDFGKLTKEMAREHIDDLYQKLEGIEQLNWMPKKSKCR